MNSTLSVSGVFLMSAILGGCAVIPAAETTTLKCGETKDTVYEIPTRHHSFPIVVQFRLACESNEKGVEVSLKNHPWGGVGKTMPRTVGSQAPDYEYIQCKEGVELKAKWDDFENYDHFADLGRPIDDIHDVQIDMRFREDYRLRHYVLYSAKNICSAAPQ